MKQILKERFNKLELGDLFLLDPEDFEYGYPVFLGKYGHIRKVDEQKNPKNFNLIYHPLGGKRETYKLLTIGNSLELWSPNRNEKRKLISCVSKIVNSQNVEVHKIYAETAYVGKKEVIEGFKKIKGMEFYADLIEKGGLIEKDLCERLKNKALSALVGGFVKPALKFKPSVMKGTFFN